MDDAEDYLPEYTGVYVDGNGNRWGHVGYYFGRRDTWISIDAPGAEFGELYPDGVPEIGEQDEKGGDMEAVEQEGQPGKNSEEAAQSQTVQKDSDRIVPKPDYSMMALTIGLVFLVVVATAALLVVLRKKGSSEKEGDGWC